MRQKVAKRLKREVYGDFSPRARKYYRGSTTGMIQADRLRQLYQQSKKEYNNVQ
jgi:hypothetical protein